MRASEKLLLSFLIFVQSGHFVSYWSQERMAEALGTSLISIKRDTKSLKEKGRIAVESCRVGKSTRNQYSVINRSQYQFDTVKEGFTVSNPAFHRLKNDVSRSQFDTSLILNCIEKGKETLSTGRDLSNLLLKKIQDRNPEFNPNVKGWPSTIALMIKNGRDPKRIEEVIEWAQADNHWRVIILNPKKLSEHFDTLLMRMQNVQDDPFERKYRQVFGKMKHGENR